MLGGREMTQWLILGRDGVINQEKPPGVLRPADFVPYPGSLAAIAELTRAGYKIVLALNQSALGRGVLTVAEFDQIHEHMRELVQAEGGVIEGIFYCPHLPEDHCNCRKPRTGLLQQIELEFGISLTNAYHVGDSLRDIQAAKAHGCKAVLVRTGKGSRTETTILVWPKYHENTLVFDDLQAFAAHLLAVR